MKSPDWRRLRDRYWLLVVAIAVVLVVPIEVRAAAWKWVLKSIDIITVVGLYRLWSMVEHRKTLGRIEGIGEKLENGIKTRLEAIEERLRTEQEPR